MRIAAGDNPRWACSRCAPAAGSKALRHLTVGLRPPLLVFVTLGQSGWLLKPAHHADDVSVNRPRIRRNLQPRPTVAAGAVAPQQACREGDRGLTWRTSSWQVTASPQSARTPREFVKARCAPLPPAHGGRDVGGSWVMFA